MHRWSWLGFGALLTLSACGGESDAECEKDEDCQEVVCPDGSKVKQCDSGTCFTLESCEGGQGW
jgi:hypothetical protein